MAEIYLDIVQRAQRFVDGQKQMRTEVGRTEQKVKETNQKMQDNFNRSGNVVNSLKAKLIGLFTIAAAAQFIRQIIAVRSEFEKYAAVLKNTLGSQLAAARAMDMIRNFAAKTPFSVRELTDAFVRLANQGFKPSEEEMRKLGDVAASTGKSFNQLAEAIIDATVGEFERLKEFGIRANKEGNKVRFTFKEVETQVDFTATAIREYILSLGDAQGVSGAMAEISKTLGGQISNLGDSWDTLLDMLGGRTSGVFATIIKGLQLISDGITNILKTDPEYRAGSRLNTFILEIENLDKVAKKTAVDKFIKELTGNLDEYNDMNLIQRKRNKENIETTELLIKLLKEHNDEIVNGTYGVDQSNKGLKNQIGSIAKLREKLTELQKTRDSLNGLDTEGINIKNNEILAIQKQIKALEDLGKVLTPDMIRRWESIFSGFKIDTDKLDKSMQEQLDYETDLFFENLDKQEQAKELDEKVKRNIEQAGAEQRQKIREEEKTAEEKAEEKVKQAKEQAMQEVANTAMMLTDLKLAKNQNAMDQELAALEEKHKKELISDEQFEDQRDLITKKYAKKNQNIAVSQALIDGSLGIMKTFKEYGFTPWGIALAALMAIQTAIQISTIKAQKFSKGVLDLKGPGTETSDSIPSMLSRRESVMTAKETKDYYPYLKAMKEGTFPRFDLDLAKKFEKNTYNNLNYDNSKEIKELRTIAGLLKNRNTEVEFIQGGQRVIKKGNVTTRINLN